MEHLPNFRLKAPHENSLRSKPRHFCLSACIMRPGCMLAPVQLARGAQYRHRLYGYFSRQAGAGHPNHGFDRFAGAFDFASRAN